MRRVPSIHITEQQLRKILLGHIPHGSKDLAKEILKEARKVSCDHRSVSISTQKIERDIKKLLKSNKGDTNLMSTILFSVRKQKKHKGIVRIKEGDNQWKQIKQLSELVLDFCNDFELPKREGFIAYVKMGFQRMSSARNHISKLINMYERISLMYEAQLIIDSDIKKQETLEIHNEYIGIISQKTGISEGYLEDPINYVNFIRVREITDKYNVPSDIYLESQFDQLQWTDGYPTPNQLVSDKAIERLNKFMYQNKLKIKVNKQEEETKGLSSMLKKLKNGNYTN